MTQKVARESAIHAYLREIKKLKTYSPDWKPISLKEYMQEFHKKKITKLS